MLQTDITPQENISLYEMMEENINWVLKLPMTTTWHSPKIFISWIPTTVNLFNTTYQKHWRQTNERPCSVYVRLSNVKRIQHKNMLVVLCQRDYVSFWCNLQAATAAHLHIWTLKLANKCRITLEHGNVKPISMTVTDKYVTCITDVDPIGVVGEVLTTNAAQKLSLLTEDDDTVPLHNNNNDLQA